MDYLQGLRCNSHMHVQIDRQMLTTGDDCACACVRLCTGGKHGNMIDSLPGLYYDGRVYDPIDYDMLDKTFCLRMRKECEVSINLTTQDGTDLEN